MVPNKDFVLGNVLQNTSGSASRPTTSSGPCSPASTLVLVDRTPLISHATLPSENKRAAAKKVRSISEGPYGAYCSFHAVCNRCYCRIVENSLRCCIQRDAPQCVIACGLAYDVIELEVRSKGRGNSRLSEKSAVNDCGQYSHLNCAGWRRRRAFASSMALFATGPLRGPGPGPACKKPGRVNASLGMKEGCDTRDSLLWWFSP